MLIQSSYSRPIESESSEAGAPKSVSTQLPSASDA